MIVPDASAVIEVLLRSPAGRAIESRLFDRAKSLHAPHLLDVEVAQILRRYALRGELTPARGNAALDWLAEVPLARYPHAALLPRMWALRWNMTAYDAAYVALAEALGATLLTRDRRLASAPGHSAAIELI